MYVDCKHLEIQIAHPISPPLPAFAVANKLYYVVRKCQLKCLHACNFLVLHDFLVTPALQFFPWCSVVALKALLEACSIKGLLWTCLTEPNRDVLHNSATNPVTPGQSPTRLQPWAKNPAKNKYLSHLLAMKTRFLPPCLLSERENWVFRVKVETYLGLF